MAFRVNQISNQSKVSARRFCQIYQTLTVPLRWPVMRVLVFTNSHDVILSGSDFLLVTIPDISQVTINVPSVLTVSRELHLSVSSAQTVLFAIFSILLSSFSLPFCEVNKKLSQPSLPATTSLLIDDKMRDGFATFRKVQVLNNVSCNECYCILQILQSLSPPQVTTFPFYCTCTAVALKAWANVHEFAQVRASNKHKCPLLPTSTISLSLLSNSTSSIYTFCWAILISTTFLFSAASCKTTVLFISPITSNLVSWLYAKAVTSSLLFLFIY